jgi:hypothetical protein
MSIHPLPSPRVNAFEMKISPAPVPALPPVTEYFLRVILDDQGLARLILTKAELAEKMRWNERKITRMMKRREIPFLKIGGSGQSDVRFILSDVINALKEKYEVKAR